MKSGSRTRIPKIESSDFYFDDVDDGSDTVYSILNWSDYSTHDRLDNNDLLQSSKEIGLLSPDDFIPKDDSDFITLDGTPVPPRSKTDIYKEWVHLTELYKSIAQYFEEKNYLPSPYVFTSNAPIINPLFTDNNLTIPEYMSDDSYLDYSIIPVIEPDTVMHTFGSVNVLNFKPSKVIVTKPDLRVAEIGFGKNKFILKSFPVILDECYHRFILMDILARQNLQEHDKYILLGRFFEEMQEVNPWDDFYLSESVFDDDHINLIEDAYDDIRNLFVFEIDEENESRLVDITGFPSKKTIIILRDFYKYICLNMLLRSHSDANTESLTGLLCNKLVTEKISPHFCLTYMAFKTLIEINNELLPHIKHDYITNRMAKVNIIDKVEEYTIPIQHIAMEQMTITLTKHFRNDFFNINVHTIDVVTTRYLDLIFQLSTALFSAQKQFNYVHNDLHSSNIMLKDFTGDMYYYMNERVLGSDVTMFPRKLFPRDKYGNIIFKNIPQRGIYKIIDHGRASVKTYDHSIVSRTPDLVARSYGVNDYQNHDYNIDLLRVLIESYDKKYYDALKYRIENNRATKKDRCIFNILKQAFTCHVDTEKEHVKGLFDVRRRECKDDIDCNRMFDWFGVYGYGDKPKCERTNKTIPQNILRHFSIFCDPTIDIRKVPLAFNMLGSL